MDITTILQQKRQAIVETAARYGAHNVRVFGSAARGDTTPESDVDLLVDMEPGRSLLDLGALHAELQELLGRKVDIVTEKGIYWLLRRRILREARPL